MAEALTFKAVTPATASDFEQLFSAKGSPELLLVHGVAGDPEEIKHSTGPDRRRQMLGRIKDAVDVGLLGYLDAEPVAWVSVAPRTNFRGLGGPDAQAGETVWSLTCMFIKRPLRKHGLTAQLIAAAASEAKARGASVLEAYPVDPSSPSYRFMGFVHSFEKAGFTMVARAGTRRHVMRLPL